jgi:hypothetical protein
LTSGAKSEIFENVGIWYLLADKMKMKIKKINIFFEIAKCFGQKIGDIEKTSTKNVYIHV